MSEEVIYKIERQRREIKVFGKTSYLYVEQKAGKKYLDVELRIGNYIINKSPRSKISIDSWLGKLENSNFTILKTMVEDTIAEIKGYEFVAPDEITLYNPYSHEQPHEYIELAFDGFYFDDIELYFEMYLRDHFSSFKVLIIPDDEIKMALLDSDIENPLFLDTWLDLDIELDVKSLRMYDKIRGNK
jgi:hypothetical protein